MYGFWWILSEIPTLCTPTLATLLVIIMKVTRLPVPNIYMVKRLLLSVHIYYCQFTYIYKPCVLTLSQFLKLWCVYPHYKISMTLKVNHTDDTFRAKQNSTVPQCHHHWTLLCHCRLDEHWHLITSLKTQEFKKLICTKEIKKIIYNKLVFKNTKITSVTSVMPTSWHIYTCRKGSNLAIWAAVLYDGQTAAVISHWQKAYSKYFILNTAIVFARINAGYNSFCFD